MRQRFIQDRDTLELIEVSADYVPEPRAQGLLVIPDIQPYQSVITGETINGRRQHREHLRAHGCIEVGNEKLTPKPMRPIPREERREAIRKAYHEWKNGKRPNQRMNHG